jgi:hypothetical protein
MRTMVRGLGMGVLAACWTLSAAAGAQQAPPIPEPSSDAERARAYFVRGADLAREARWAEALASFERAEAVKRHAVTTYNIGACERAMGRYTRARKAFARALAEHEAAGGAELPASLVDQTRAFLREIDGLLVRLALRVRPTDAAIAIDGIPLEPLEETSARGGEDAGPALVAGTLRAAEPERVPADRFDVLLDPGAHVIMLVRKGFAPAVVRRNFVPGARPRLELELDRLPATLRVRANEPDALVLVNGADAGPAPVELLRPAGSYRIVVQKDGFVPYETQLHVAPGEEASLRATLTAESPSLLEQWWFWTAAGAAVVGGVVLTYALTRPEPEPPPYDGGSTGWVVFPQGLR